MKIPSENDLEAGQPSSSDESQLSPGPSSDEPNDFSEYMWMENQEEFDRQVLQELEQVVGTPSPRDPGDFSEFMWMENEEEFDKEVLRQLEQEALMKSIESMLDDEDTNSVQKNSDFVREFSNLRVQDKTDLVKKSTLNPNAAEFVPKVALETK